MAEGGFNKPSLERHEPVGPLSNDVETAILKRRAFNQRMREESGIDFSTFFMKVRERIGSLKSMPTRSQVAKAIDVLYPKLYGEVLEYVVDEYMKDEAKSEKQADENRFNDNVARLD